MCQGEVYFGGREEKKGEKKFSPQGREQT